MRETGQAVGCLSYQHLQKPRALDDEAWIDTLGRVGSLRYQALNQKVKVGAWRIAKTIRPDTLIILSSFVRPVHHEGGPNLKFSDCEFEAARIFTCSQLTPGYTGKLFYKRRLESFISFVGLPRTAGRDAIGALAAAGRDAIVGVRLPSGGHVLRCASVDGC